MYYFIDGREVSRKDFINTGMQVIDWSTNTYEEEFELIRKLGAMIDSNEMGTMTIDDSQFNIRPTKLKQYMINNNVVSKEEYVKRAVQEIFEITSDLSDLKHMLGAFTLDVLESKPLYVNGYDFVIMKEIE